ncbi:phosphoadenosine phosphosulfate reductase family protein [Streptomyces demainii]|uniref:3'-phosphoadenosine 5'-phosphosulfate sulfotransferase (PAPS reductase)/FAD synthetase n=1 Tax=Streptomyces demainii TaxID=588122 RepID=A0ABT9KVL1_9ACTN|nr:phosphoadenosine phosphosulfate reductase family protein [Streptomyces demainii]MDP9611527.1 3'-phosphoadenosine 5'-phosphosulfate sulfotransferase (PAPS reductase)/FAD synthetase [Streptomyces demainii]
MRDNRKITDEAALEAASLVSGRSRKADEERIAALTTQAHAILDQAIEREVLADNRTVAGVVILFSGGNDSTTLAHLFKDRATHAAHANTGIGIEQTRQYVRDTCAAWGLPLIEKYPEPGATYRDLVLGQCKARTGPNAGTVLWPGGFPGPAAHWMMYQRLKERALEKVRADLVTNPYRERVIFLAGRRAEESGRRKHLAVTGPVERRGSTVWVSPLVGWTKLDLNAYRRVHPDVPRNEVSDVLHMSGECLCGAFAHAGELDEIAEWYPETAAEIRALEAEVLAAGVAAPERCRWGWGAGKERPSRVGPLCSSCDSRFQASAESADGVEAA